MALILRYFTEFVNDVAVKQLKSSVHKEVKSTYQMIPEVGTKVMCPKTRDTAISYCRILLHMIHY